MISYRRDLWQVIEPPVLDAVEIGVAEGRFSKEMLEWPVAFPRVFLVDAWQTLPQSGDGGFPQEWHEQNLRDALEKVEPFGDRVAVLRGRSAEMAVHVADQSLSLVYVDCDHSYEGVRSDLLAWESKLASGGVLAVHDYENPAYGVKPAFDEFCAARGWDLNLLPEDRPEDAGAWARKP